MFVAEYGEEKWNEKYGAEGRMPFRPNNSFEYIPYEPEYDRYGGAAGVELAEWHFEKSSDIVARLLRDTNSHVHSILLGLSLQLTTIFCYGFLEEEQRIVDFLTGYIQYWRHSYSIMTDAVDATYNRRYDHLANNIEQRVSYLKEATLSRSVETQLTATEQEWISHVHCLRERVDALVSAGRLEFGGYTPTSQPTSEGSHHAVYNILLHSYIHMTNNRLGVLFSDEVYLAYLLRRCMSERQLIMS